MDNKAIYCFIILLDQFRFSTWNVQKLFIVLQKNSQWHIILKANRISTYWYIFSKILPNRHKNRPANKSLIYFRFGEKLTLLLNPHYLFLDVSIWGRSPILLICVSLCIVVIVNRWVMQYCTKFNIKLQNNRWFGNVNQSLFVAHSSMRKICCFPM
jgi:hypothetical protein